MSNNDFELVRFHPLLILNIFQMLDTIMNTLVKQHNIH